MVIASFILTLALAAANGANDVPKGVATLADRRRRRPCPGSLSCLGHEIQLEAVSQVGWVERRVANPGARAGELPPEPVVFVSQFLNLLVRGFQAP